MLPVPAASWAAVGSVAETVPTATARALGAALGTNVTTPDTDQSPGVSASVATLAVVAVVSETGLAWLVDSCSPTMPAAALEASVTPFSATVFGTSTLLSVPSLARLPASALTAFGPAGPVAPGLPGSPTGPCAPCAPGVPVAPVSPFGPC